MTHTDTIQTGMLCPELRLTCLIPQQLHQVTAKEIRQLDGPTKVLPMEILEIDISSGLVVGMNGYVPWKETLDREIVAFRLSVRVGESSCATTVFCSEHQVERWRFCGAVFFTRINTKPELENWSAKHAQTLQAPAKHRP